MFDLLHPRLSDLALATRRLVRLLDKAMQHDDSFGNQRTEEYTRNPFGAFQSQLEQTLTKGFGMRCPQVRAEHNHSSSEHDKSRRQRIGQAQNLDLHDFVAIGDRAIHNWRITNMLITIKMEIIYSKRDSSMLEFTAIVENGEVACDDEAGRLATVRTDERRLDRYHWNLAGHHRHCNRKYRARLGTAFGETSATFFDKTPLHK